MGPGPGSPQSARWRAVLPRVMPPVGLKQSDGLGPPRLSNLGGGVGQMPITIFIGQKRKNRQEGLSQTTSNSIPGM